MRALLLALLFLPSPAFAQALTTPTEQRIADIASYATVGLNIALDTRSSCWQAADRKRGCVMEAARLGTTWGSVALLKHYLPRDRPCAPSCGIDAPNADFPSGHTAFAVTAASDARTWFFAFNTGELRILANKHDLIGVLGGAAVGAATGRLLR